MLHKNSKRKKNFMIYYSAYMMSYDNKAWTATGVEIITGIQLATENYWAKGKLVMTVNPGTTGYSSFSNRELTIG
jgi:hypothetical protein